MTVNLNEFDKVSIKLDKTKTWLYIKGKVLISNELPKYEYYNLFKQFNTQLNSNLYYIILAKQNINNQLKPTNIDDYGRVKIPISNIYYESGLNRELKDCNINLICTEEDEDSVVYLIDY